MNEKIVVR